MFPDLPVKVATIPSLIALKVLSADPKDRLQDIIDLRNLIREATDSEILLAKNLIDLITERGYNRKKDLHGELDKYISDSLVRP